MGFLCRLVVQQVNDVFDPLFEQAVGGHVRRVFRGLVLDEVPEVRVVVLTDGAIEAAAEQALARKTGARALRSIVEESLLDVMYDIPERSDVRKCIITEEVIRDGRTPLLLTKAHIDQGVDETNYDEHVRKGA